MNKKDYKQPTTKAVVLQQQSHLLANSVEATRNSYGIANSDVDNSEKDGNGMWNWD